MLGDDPQHSLFGIERIVAFGRHLKRYRDDETRRLMIDVASLVLGRGSGMFLMKAILTKIDIYI